MTVATRPAFDAEGRYIVTWMGLPSKRRRASGATRRMDVPERLWDGVRRRGALLGMTLERAALEAVHAHVTSPRRRHVHFPDVPSVAYTFVFPPCLKDELAAAALADGRTQAAEIEDALASWAGVEPGAPAAAPSPSHAGDRSLTVWVPARCAESMREAGGASVASLVVSALERAARTGVSDGSCADAARWLSMTVAERRRHGTRRQVSIGGREGAELERMARDGGRELVTVCLAAVLQEWGGPARP